jgi:preprotein translocase SecF subunit
VIIGLALMLVYISLRFNYRFGVGTVVALFHDVLITLGIFTLLNKEITTAIVAAFLTIVGYSINDSIVVSDRIRENLKKLGGKVPLTRFTQVVNSSINETLSRTVITAFTTLLVLLAILIFGGPVIFDFAFALAVGIVVGTYSSIFVVAALVVEARSLTTRSRSKA